MDRTRGHILEDLMFSFRYAGREQASRCNTKLEQLMEHSIFPELGKSFDQVAFGEINLELERMEIDLGMLSEADLSEELGERIRPLLIEALKKAIKAKILGENDGLESAANSERINFSLLALKVFLLRGYFPAWADSKLDLRALLDFLLLSPSVSLAKMIRDVSVRSESARKRLAFLEAGYFDRIIKLLVPEDADWIIGYRNTYVEIHQTDRGLSASSENLEKALNLFILTFLSQNQSTKFNRFSFSDRFLKSIAAHYHLDFKVFLRQITEILAQDAVENQLFREFREAVIWVGRKNDVSMQEADDVFAPTSESLITWLNNGGEAESIQSWLDEIASTGMLFTILSRKFSGFWRSLNKSGLTRLIRLMGGDEHRQWLDTIYSYLAWSSGKSQGEAVEQIATVRGIFDLAQGRSMQGKYELTDLDSWYFFLVVHGMKSFGADMVICQELLELGLRAGISGSPLLVLTARSQVSADEGRADERESGNSPELTLEGLTPKTDTTFDFALASGQILVNYLRSGTLRLSVGALSQSDLQTIVTEMIKSQDASLLNLLKNASFEDFSALKHRLASLMTGVNREEIYGYMKRFAGSEILRWLRFSENLIASELIPPKLSQRIDRMVWEVFLKEIYFQGKDGKVSTISSYFYPIELILNVLSDMGGSLVFGQQTVSKLQKNLNLEKTALISLGFQAADIRLLQRLASAKNASIQGIDLLQPKYRALTAHLKQKEVWNLFLKTSGKSASILDQLVWTLHQSSFLARLQTGRFNGAELDGKVSAIIGQDLRKLQRISLLKPLGASGKADLQSAIRRILMFSKIKPATLVWFLKENEDRLRLIASSLRMNLDRAEWEALVHFFGRSGLADLERLSGEISKSDDRKAPVFVMGKSALVNWEEIRLLVEAPSNDNARAREVIGRLLPNYTLLSDQILYLLEIPSRSFSRKSSSRLWRRLVLLSVYQIRLSNRPGDKLNPTIFWKAFLPLLKDNKTAFGPEKLDWSKIVRSKHLDFTSKKLLRQFYKKHYLSSHLSFGERLSSAIQYWKKEGFLPWWSPIKSGERLIATMVFTIENSVKGDALLMISVFSNGGISRLLDNFSKAQLRRLQARLSGSAYRKQFSSAIEEIQRTLAKLENASHRSILESEVDLLSGLNSQSDLRTPLREDLEVWIKSQINSSKEIEILDTWLGGDNRIFRQMEELMQWSSFMFFGNLTPGKWKLWLLSFGFDFYVDRANSFSASFLSQFLRHLYRTHAAVNWRSVFYRLLKNKGFQDVLSTQDREELGRFFPTRQTKEAEEPATGDQVKVSNAGLILCWPFISALFSRLKLSSGGIVPPESQGKAVYLLQYLVFGHVDFPEYEMVLNKLLVGMKASQHLEQTELSEEEMQMALSLLNGLKGNWEKMKNASVDAIRQTFLQREGTLEFGAASNILKVPKTGVDVLLDSISWNISVVKLPWMEKSLEVKWR
jgi:hypothetical protein